MEIAVRCIEIQPASHFVNATLDHLQMQMIPVASVYSINEQQKGILVSLHDLDLPGFAWSLGGSNGDEVEDLAYVSFPQGDHLMSLRGRHAPGGKLDYWHNDVCPGDDPRSRSPAPALHGPTRSGPRAAPLEGRVGTRRSHRALRRRSCQQVSGRSIPELHRLQ